MNSEEFQKKVLEMMAETVFDDTDAVMDIRSMALAMQFQMDDMLMRMIGMGALPADGPVAQNAINFYRGGMWMTHTYLPTGASWQEFLQSCDNLLCRKALSSDSDLTVDLALRGLSGLLAAFAVNAVIRQWHPEMPVETLAANGRMIESAINSVLVAELQKHDKDSGIRN